MIIPDVYRLLDSLTLTLLCFISDIINRARDPQSQCQHVGQPTFKLPEISALALQYLLSCYFAQIT